ncbi:geranylgeranyl pyrophosphate synthase [Catenaria anguillulae PL171]|uniref:Geranylgeranyl pyrophosphate synthase n=1 Tax=Catenaria anguillulae PL171 TaxID=765915 RepID=A0A1Y2HBT3_9FUNG|nr:geranylgeranyl pyrophosphate synthase [Catenaria anguillulae PL171]
MSSAFNQHPRPTYPVAENASWAPPRHGSSPPLRAEFNHLPYNPPLPPKDTTRDEILLAPYAYLQKNPGKGVRSKIFAAFNKWCQVPDDKLAIISKVVEMLHGGSLLIDDIEDESHLRRGRPVAHRVFGMANTINSANYVYFLALREVQLLKHANGDAGKGVAIFTEELINAHEGQGMEIFWRENLVCPTEDEYLEMVGNKTSALLRLGVRLMVEYSVQAQPQAVHTYTSLSTQIGNLFQIRDDYINLVSAEFAVTKGYCEDIEEGKFSFPMIHSIRSTPHDRQLLNILKQRPTDRHLKDYALTLLRETQSLEYTRKYLCALDAQIAGWIQELGGNDGLAKLLVYLRREYADKVEEKIQGQVPVDQF